MKKGIVEQFFGPLIDNPLIVEKIKEIEKLIVDINSISYSYSTVNPELWMIELDMWMIGPVRKDNSDIDAGLKEDLRLWGLKDGQNSGDMPIRKIAVDIKKSIIYVIANNDWYICRSNKSAYMYAKYLDNILTGVYTDVIPINTYILSENMKDIAEKVNSK